MTVYTTQSDASVTLSPVRSLSCLSRLNDSWRISVLNTCAVSRRLVCISVPFITAQWKKKEESAIMMVKKSRSEGGEACVRPLLYC